MSPADQMPRAQLAAAAVSVLALVLLLGSIVWVGSTVLGALEVETNTKADILETLRRRPLPSRSADGGIAIPPEVARLAGETEAVAANRLQEIATSAVEAAGGLIVSAEVVRIVDGLEATRRIVVSVAFEADITALQEILFSLETGVPFILVDALTMQPTEAGGRLDDERLRTSLVVSGFWRAPPPATAGTDGGPLAPEGGT